MRVVIAACQQLLQPRHPLLAGAGVQNASRGCSPLILSDF